MDHGREPMVGRSRRVNKQLSDPEEVPPSPVHGLPRSLLSGGRASLVDQKEKKKELQIQIALISYQHLTVFMGINRYRDGLIII